MFDQWNVSLKLAHSGVAAEVRVRADAIAAFRDRDAWFKFVVATERDVDEVLEIQAAHRVPSQPPGVGTAAWSSVRR